MSTFEVKPYEHEVSTRQGPMMPRPDALTPKEFAWVSWFVITLALLIISLVMPVEDAATGFFMIAFAIVLVTPFFVYLIKGVNQVLNQTVQAMQPVLSPQQINIQLSQELGRPATMVEVAAVHQMLTSEKNQQMINSGVTLGALYLIGRNL